MRVARANFTSRGHLDDAWSAVVRMAETPSCTLWIEELGRSGKNAEVILGIESPTPAHGDPWFFVATTDGAMLRRGALSDCSGCHGAAHRGVFTSEGKPPNETVTGSR
jgi:hypothetical protein